MHQAAHNKEVNIFDTVLNMRKERAQMVQTEVVSFLLYLKHCKCCIFLLLTFVSHDIGTIWIPLYLYGSFCSNEAKTACDDY